MIDWHSAEVEDVCFFVFKQISAFSFGAYLWHYFLTFGEVEWRLLRGQLQFCIAHIPYLTARYFQIIAFVLLLIFVNFSANSVMDCSHAVLLRCILIFANVALAASTTNLGFRAFMIWHRNIYVSGFLIFRCLCQWVLAIHLGVVSVPTKWNHTECQIDMTMQPEAIVFYLYTVLGNAVYLFFTAYGLHKEFNSSRSSHLLSVLLTHGVICMFIGCVTCIPSAVMLWLNLNSFMNMLLAPLANTISVIASSSAVISLINMKESVASESDPAITLEAKRPRLSSEVNSVASSERKRDSQHEFTTHIALHSSLFWNSGDLTPSQSSRHCDTSESTV